MLGVVADRRPGYDPGTAARALVFSAAPVDMNPILRALVSRVLGREGERAAARYLRGKGMKILYRGYRASVGEIDLIARDGDRLVFVEVKTRRRGIPAEAVDPGKQRRITLTALHFQRKFGVLGVGSRFDIVSVTWPEAATAPVIEHELNAFEAVGRGQMFR